MRTLRLAAALLIAAAALVPAAAAGARSKTKPGTYTITYRGTTKQGEKVDIVVKMKLFRNPDYPPDQLDITHVTATASTAATVHCDADDIHPVVDKRYEFRGSSSTVHYTADYAEGGLGGFMGGAAESGVSASANIGGTVKKLKDRLPTKKSVFRGNITASADPKESGGRTCIAGDPRKGVAFTAKLVSTKRR
jgi:hypothetical protein